MGQIVEILGNATKKEDRFNTGKYKNIINKTDFLKQFKKR